MNANRKLPSQHPFRRAVLRGLGVVLPPLLTIVILAWIFNTVQLYVLNPAHKLAERTIVWQIDDILASQPPGAQQVQPTPGGRPQFVVQGKQYVQVGENQWIPSYVFDRVRQSPGRVQPITAEDYYRRFVKLEYLKYELPVFVVCFVLVLYFLGRFMAAGVGRILWVSFERIIHQLPIIRSVYSSVKQVTDFIFSESDVSYTRVVAVEYPRKGCWSLGFVTGESLPDLRDAAGEPVVCLLMPTSPMPATGFTITVRKSEVVDLNITVDQAFQFIVSCGVVAPKPEVNDVAQEMNDAIQRHLAINGATG